MWHTEVAEIQSACSTSEDLPGTRVEDPALPVSYIEGETYCGAGRRHPVDHLRKTHQTHAAPHIVYAASPRNTHSHSFCDGRGRDAIKAELDQPIAFRSQNVATPAPHLLAQQAHRLCKEFTFQRVPDSSREVRPTSQSTSAVAIDAMLANNHEDAANNCNQSPLELTPISQHAGDPANAGSRLSEPFDAQRPCESASPHARRDPPPRGLAGRVRSARRAGSAHPAALSSFPINIRTPPHSRRGHRDTSPTCGTFPTLPPAALTRSQWLWRRRRNVVDTCR